MPFLSILQHLLRIDPKEPISDMIWDTAERLVNRSTLIENNEDAKKIMRAPSKHKSLHRLKSMDGQLCPSCAMIRKQSMESNNGSALSNGTTGLSLPPPPPPPPPPRPPPPRRSPDDGSRPSLKRNQVSWRVGRDYTYTY